MDTHTQSLMLAVYGAHARVRLNEGKVHAQRQQTYNTKTHTHTHSTLT